MIAVAVIAVLAGGLTAIFRSGASHNHARYAHAHTLARVRPGHAHGSGDIAVAADYLGISRVQLRHDLQVHHTLGQVADATSGRSASALLAALVSAKVSKLESRVASGKLTPAQESRASAALHARAAAALARPRGLASATGDVALAATYLGVSRAQLRHEHKSGHSLAQLADAHPGKSAAGLIDAVMAAKTKLTATATATSKLSPAQRQLRLAQMRRRVTAAVERTPTKAPAN